MKNRATIIVRLIHPRENRMMKEIRFWI